MSEVFDNFSTCMTNKGSKSQCPYAGVWLYMGLERFCYLMKELYLNRLIN